MKKCWILILVVYIHSTCYIQAIKWLALSRSKFIWNSTSHCFRSRKQHELLSSQTKFCRRHLEMMPHVATAASRAVFACQNVFKDRRWNCSSIQLAPKFNPDLTSGTREQAYVYAISSAAVAYTLARACSAGHLASCSCALRPHEPPSGNFQWGGCGDNVKFGVKLAKAFVDSPWINKKNKKTLKAVVHQHNNLAGTKAVEYSLKTQCKCHGVSGSCNIKTCWRALPASLPEIADRLKRKYAIAMEVVSRKIAIRRQLHPTLSHLGMFKEDDLVYTTTSPDYCLREPRSGSIGTHGRLCNVTADGHLGCDSMCCGRGYYTYVTEKVERCKCKYHWCCYVKCKQCTYRYEIHECK